MRTRFSNNHWLQHVSLRHGGSDATNSRSVAFQRSPPCFLQNHLRASFQKKLQTIGDGTLLLRHELCMTLTCKKRLGKRASQFLLFKNVSIASISGLPYSCRCQSRFVALTFPCLDFV